jgi:hypothetical protein
MREPAKQPSSSSSRAKRAQIAGPSVPSIKKRKSGASNTRGLRPESLADDWRRIEMGTNHIACFGVWRRGARRQAGRVNRSHTTRWHMPHRSGAAFLLIGVANDAAHEA